MAQSTTQQGTESLHFGVNLLREGKFDEAFEFYRHAFNSIAQVEEKHVREFVETLLSVEQTRLLEERTTMSSHNAREMNNMLSCTLCQKLFDTPVTLVCGHTFCTQCLAQQDACPSCDFSLTADLHYSLNLVVRDLVRSYLEEEVILKERINTAEKCLKEGNYRETLNLIDGLFQKYPNNVNLFYLRSKVFLQANCHDRALGDLETVCKLCPLDSKAFFSRGEILFTIGNYEEAVTMFLRASVLQPDDIVSKERLSKCLCEIFTKTSQIYMNLETSNELKLDRTSLFSQEAPCLTHNSFSDRSIKTSEVTHLLDTVNTTNCPGSIVDDFECQLCYNIVYKPVTTPCGHTYCRACLARSLDHRFECPTCRTNLQGYLELVIKGYQGVCETIEKILMVKFENEYNVRKVAYESELRSGVNSENNTVAEIPIFICTLAVPNIICPLHIFHPHYKLMIRRCMESGSQQFGMCVPDDEHEFASVGTVLEITNIEYMPDGRSIIQTVGGRRFKVLARCKYDGYSMATVEWLVDHDNDDHTPLTSQVYNLTVSWFSNLTSEHQHGIIQAIGQIPNKHEKTTNNTFNWYWWLLAAIPLNIEAKLIILSMASVNERLSSAKRFLDLLLKQQTGQNLQIIE